MSWKQRTAVIGVLALAIVGAGLWWSHRESQWIEGDFQIVVKSADFEERNVKRYRWRGRTLEVVNSDGQLSRIGVPGNAAFQISGKVLPLELRGTKDGFPLAVERD